MDWRVTWKVCRNHSWSKHECIWVGVVGITWTVVVIVHPLEAPRVVVALEGTVWQHGEVQGHVGGVGVGDGGGEGGADGGLGQA